MTESAACDKSFYLARRVVGASKALHDVIIWSHYEMFSINNLLVINLLEQVSSQDEILLH